MCNHKTIKKRSIVKSLLVTARPRDDPALKLARLDRGLAQGKRLPFFVVFLDA